MKLIIKYIEYYIIFIIYHYSYLFSGYCRILVYNVCSVEIKFVAITRAPSGLHIPVKKTSKQPSCLVTQSIQTELKHF